MMAIATSANTYCVKRVREGIENMFYFCDGQYDLCARTNIVAKYVKN